MGITLASAESAHDFCKEILTWFRTGSLNSQQSFTRSALSAMDSPFPLGSAWD
jgi:hypothetical protein